MAEYLFTRIWLGRLVFLACTAFVVFLYLIPLRFSAGFLPRPDLLAGLVLAFVLRRPEFVPIWLIALVFFLADLLLLRPPGLWAAVMVGLCAFTRAQEYRLRELGFVFEWVFVAGVLFVAILLNRLILALAVVPQPEFGAVMFHYFVTVLTYPGVVFFCHFFLRLRKITPDQAIRFGHRL